MTNFISALFGGAKSGKPAKRYTLYAILATAAVLVVALLTLVISSIVFALGGGEPADTDAETGGDEGTPSASSSLGLVSASFEEAQLYSGELLIFNSECPYNGESANAKSLVNLAEKRSKKPESDADFPYYYTVFMDTAKSATSATQKALDAMIVDYYSANNNDDNLIVSKAVGAGGNYESGLLVELRYYNGDSKDAIDSETHTWVYANAHKYGFINTTGNIFRYVGVTHATYMQSKGIATLEEYLELLSTRTASSPLNLGNGFYAFYVAKSDGGAVSSKYSYTVSGNNKDGYIITVNKNTPAENG